MRAAASEPGHTRTMCEYVLGGLLALGAVAAWTWYPIVNSCYLRANQHISQSISAAAKGR